MAVLRVAIGNVKPLINRDAFDGTVTGSVKSVKLQGLDPADKTKLVTVENSRLIEASQGSQLVTYTAADGSQRLGQIVVSEYRTVAAAKNKAAELNVIPLSEALSDKAIVDLHAVASLDAEVAISE
jgi:hypothetical protein